MNMTYNFLTGLSRPVKRAILLSIDLSLMLFSLFGAFALKFGTAIPIDQIGNGWVLFPLLLLICAALSLLLKLPSIKLHAFDNSATIRIGICAVGLALVTLLLGKLIGLNVPPSVPVIMGISFFFAATSARQVGYVLLHSLHRAHDKSVPVAIYGAGAAGIQLALALRQAQEVRPVVFVDDNPALHGLMLAGHKVAPPAVLARLAARGRIKKVLVAIPSLSALQRRKVMATLANIPLEIQFLPSFVEMLNGNGIENNLRTVSPDALLGRDKVKLSGLGISMVYAGRAAMITGAGGSIGSELCRQLMGCGLSKIVLFEQSEYALYQIDQELRPVAQEMGVALVSRLGSVTDPARVKQVIAEEGVEIILHAAAYKHVPLVEGNELEGARNNVRGTQVVAEAACDMGVERFILISTDKAVRPTNVMGATKRMAELVVQDLQTRHPKTKLSMVRFGNVLGSSGSVLPLFQRQIQAGGPVTVTHAEVTRFFMTIPEAARLVLLAGAYAKGGDVFVLDMGKPMKIIDIARRMIELSGRSVKDANNPEGDIELVITGLRPGEKLFEELLLNAESLQVTLHEKILRAEEGSLSEIEVAAMLKELDAALRQGSRIRLRALLERRVEGYHQQSVMA